MFVELKKAAYAGNVSGKFDNYAEWDYNSFMHGTEIYRSFRKISRDGAVWKLVGLITRRS